MADFRCSDGLVAGAVGTTSFGGITYNTVAENVTGLLPVGSNGVNHGAFLLPGNALCF